MEATVEAGQRPPLAKVLFLETRPQFLTLIPCVLTPGVALAYAGGHFNWAHLILALIGSLLVHISVNVLNDYTDWVRGTDKLVQRTPFSGGSGLIKAGMISPRMVLIEGVAALCLSLVIGIYFVYLYPVLLWFVVGGALLTVFYTPVLTKTVITEIFPGLGFGVIPVIGAYIVMQPVGKVAITPEVIWLSIPATILVSGLLWINEIPDIQADKATGRRHAVLLMGTQKAAWGYVALLVMTYVSIVTPIALGILPVWCLAGLLTIPLAVKAGTGAVKNHDSIEGITPALGQNILTVLATPVLLAIGLVVSKLVG
ncbi:MAG: prenyltransferase [Actinomycetota bacterium]